MPHSFKESLQLYLDKRMLWIFIMGICSGFPSALIGSNLSGWLKDSGISRGEIGLLGTVTFVYALNFLWAPLIDRLKIPGLSRFGSRKSWVITTQLITLFILLGLAQLQPTQNLFLFAVLAFAIACCSATQDIAIDAFRIDQFNSDEADKFPAAAAMSIIGWWTGYSGPGYLAFKNADALGWNQVYLVMAAVLCVLIIATFFVQEKSRESSRQRAFTVSPETNIESWLHDTFTTPFKNFFQHNGVRVALALLLFVFLFKLGEAFLGRMSIVFYKEIGFSNEQIANITKAFGWLLTVTFTLVGSVFNSRFGVIRGLLIGGIAMASSNLLYSIIAETGPKPWLLMVTLVVDNFTAAFSSVALVAFLSAITNKSFSATQYALFASIGNFGRISLAGASGYMVDLLGSWSVFFIVTTLMVIPSLILLMLIRKDLTRVIATNRD